MTELPWAKVFQPRCAARTEDYERCDLVKRHDFPVHALERGIGGPIFWSTQSTDEKGNPISRRSREYGS